MKRIVRTVKRAVLLVTAWGWNLLVWTGALSALLNFLHPWLVDDLHVPKWLFTDANYIVGGFAILVSIMLVSGVRYAVHIFAMRLLGSMLKICLSVFSESERTTWHLKCNIMLPFDGYLKEILRYGNHPAQRTIPWRIGQGVCGVAFAEREDRLAHDLTQYQHKDFRDIVQQDDGQPLWGMTVDQWEHTKHLGSVWSFPLKISGTSNKVLGILSIDSTAPLATWGTDGREEKFLLVKNLITPLIAVILESRAIQREVVEDGPETAT